jgi:flagellar hook assembly protein FlgD
MTFPSIDPSRGTVANSQANAPSSSTGQDAFLQLLVAQVRNQNPLSPTDGTQFVAQLAQFSSLEQLTAIRGELEQLRTEALLSSSVQSPVDGAQGQR